MKDYIEITDINNKKRLVEVITIFQLYGFDSNYIIYRELNKSHDYIARYQEDNKATLDTNLSKLEFQLANIIYRGVKQWV